MEAVYSFYGYGVPAQVLEAPLQLRIAAATTIAEGQITTCLKMLTSKNISGVKAVIGKAEALMIKHGAKSDHLQAAILKEMVKVKKM